MINEKPSRRRLQSMLASSGLALGLVLSGCAAPKATSTTAVYPLDKAVAQATASLLAQAEPSALGKLLPARGIVVDPMIDAGSGQQTEATQLVQMLVSEQLGSQPGIFALLPFEPSSISKATYLLTGTLKRQVGNASAPVKIQLALTEMRSGKVAAQASALARDDGLDGTPVATEQDSPILPTDKVISGYVRTTETPPGENADAYYMERIAVAPMVKEAAASYAAGKYEDALKQYSAAAALPAGEQLRVLSGIYLAQVKLNKMVEAEQTFGKIVAYGIASKELGVKFLFTPGTTEFWADPAVSGQYAMWMGQLARGSSAAKVCMRIVGHTSRTGTQEFNDKLSLDRANAIQQKLTTQAADLAGRTTPEGKGFRENIIGTGTDNAVDALDRRVEFKVVPCA
ncbi:OmpA family protein [Variovorax sp. J22R133]|uniref:OmpA family protein n=1 Tax=Variovorax brevis TaxID=3053503 RepID=UPI0025760731|nr:OmpA family protein [Variovorax sp. J22R133]MDM0117091.1 OmpA family protein [Variovorax sp. J22R133]